jgi:hypothetical protein
VVNFVQVTGDCSSSRMPFWKSLAAVVGEPVLLNMSVTLEQFRKEGWKLTEEGLELLKEWSEVDDPTFDQCLAVALNVSSSRNAIQEHHCGGY